MSRESRALSEELERLDRAILNNKKELLKRVLKHERVELLHRSLHGTRQHHQQGTSIISDGSKRGEPSSSAAIDDAEDDDAIAMREELEELDRAILEGKRSVLKVMKHLEQSHSNDVDACGK